MDYQIYSNRYYPSNVTFDDYKRRLWLYEESQKMNEAESSENVMKTHYPPRQTLTARRMKMPCNMQLLASAKVPHTKNPSARKGVDKMAAGRSWRSKTVTGRTISWRDQTTGMRDHQAVSTSHIVNDTGKFESFGDTFRRDSHSVESADGTTEKNSKRLPTWQRWTAESNYKMLCTRHLFSVTRATNGGVTITFQKTGQWHGHQEREQVWYPWKWQLVLPANCWR